MTVAQTSQLIQLILNTSLLLAIAVAWWAMTWMRHGTIASRLRAAQQKQDPENRPLLRSLQRQHRLGRYSINVMHYVLLGLATSLLALSLRTLLGADWLISLSLVLFVGAVGGLTLSVGLTVMEFYQAKLPRRRRVRSPRRLPASQPQPRLLPEAKRDRLAS